MVVAADDFLPSVVAGMCSDCRDVEVLVIDTG
jgi:hypothetical protein